MDPQILIDGRRLEALIVRSLERMAGIAEGLGLVGPALVSITLEGVEDVELTRARPGGRAHPPARGDAAQGHAAEPDHASGPGAPRTVRHPMADGRLAGRFAALRRRRLGRV